MRNAHHGCWLALALAAVAIAGLSVPVSAQGPAAVARSLQVGKVVFRGPSLTSAAKLATTPEIRAREYRELAQEIEQKMWAAGISSVAPVPPFAVIQRDQVDWRPFIELPEEVRIELPKGLLPDTAPILAPLLGEAPRPSEGSPPKRRFSAGRICQLFVLYLDWQAMWFAPDDVEPWDALRTIAGTLDAVIPESGQPTLVKCISDKLKELASTHKSESYSASGESLYTVYVLMPEPKDQDQRLRSGITTALGELLVNIDTMKISPTPSFPCTDASVSLLAPKLCSLSEKESLVRIWSAPPVPVPGPSPVP